MSVIDDLQELEHGDRVRLAIDGGNYSGVVTEYYHEPLEYENGIPINGSLRIGVELDNETVDRTDVKTHTLAIDSKEKRGGFTDPEATIWEPATDDSDRIVGDEYRTLGVVKSVEVVE
ncbi:hypothetical protein ACFQGT_00035 [Natrialbaceae archaeon GCM10025810]